jgi:hypothetical protein
MADATFHLGPGAVLRAQQEKDTAPTPQGAIPTVIYSQRVSACFEPIMPDSGLPYASHGIWAHYIVARSERQTGIIHLTKFYAFMFSKLMSTKMVDYSLVSRSSQGSDPITPPLE